MTQHTNLYATQPEALRLADLMDAMDYDDTQAAAIELRRLHELNVDKTEIILSMFDSNAQLLEALEDYAQYGMSQKARAAIKAAKGEA